MTIPDYNTSTKVLPQQVQALLQSTYPRRQGWKAANALSQGERDVLEMARELLGWVSITSLAYKYWPLYPDRKLWQRAVERCRRHKPRYKTHPIQYLLLTIATVKAWWQKAAFSSKEDPNRIVHSINTHKDLDIYRIVHQGGIVNIPSLDFKGYTLVKSFRAIQQHEGNINQDAQLACAAA
mgnify:CR=1 FL=1